MFDNTSLEQFSLLDELPSVTPVWRPFPHGAASTPAVAQETSKEAADRSH